MAWYSYIFRVWFVMYRSLSDIRAEARDAILQGLSSEYWIGVAVIDAENDRGLKLKLFRSR